MSTWLHIETPWRELLESAGFADLGAWRRLAESAELLRSLDGRIVSLHRDRRTVALALPGPTRLFAKIQTATDPKRVATDLLHLRHPRSAAVVERDWLARLAELGIHAMEAVAVGEDRRFGVPAAAVLVVRAVPAEQDLAALLKDRPELADDPELWSAIGRLVGTLHRSGIRWPDLSAKHLFPRPLDGGWRIWLIDVERMVRSSDPRTARGDWGELLKTLPARLGPRAAGAMAEAYVAAWPGGDPSGRAVALVRRVESTPVRAPLPRWLERGQELLTHGELIVNARYESALSSAGLTTLDGVFDYPSGQSLTKPGLPPGRRRDRVTLDGVTFYLKRYRATRLDRLARRLRRARRASEAADEWHALWRLAGGGLAVPEPVLFGQDAARRTARRSCIGLVELDDAESLERWLPRRGPELAPEQRRALLDGLADFIARFHSLGTVHRDLYLSHVFVRWDGEGPSFRLIDLARVFRPRRWRRRRWVVKDLAQLRYSLGEMVSDGEWRSFLQRYLGVESWTSPAARLDARVGSKAASIARRAARRRARTTRGG